MTIIRRGGHIHLALPTCGEGAGRTLGLYQPQRPAARFVVRLLRALSVTGLHKWLPGGYQFVPSPDVRVLPSLPVVRAESCGVMLGSREHRIPRAISSYRTETGWEVAKIAFGTEGQDLLENEAEALTSLSAVTHAAPPCLGLHRGSGVTILRMPYLTGKPVPAGDSVSAMKLLESWISCSTPQSPDKFVEWPSVVAAVTPFTSGQTFLAEMETLKLRPVLCHGDFARWNLLQKPDGGLVVLDWEWGHTGGMPGIDLVHFFLQDARLVQRLDDRSAISATLLSLGEPACRSYLEKTGWSTGPLAAIVACLAYKQGAGHQENLATLETALSFTA